MEGKLTTTMEKQLEKDMEIDMETLIIQGFIGLAYWCFMESGGTETGMEAFRFRGSRALERERRAKPQTLTPSPSLYKPGLHADFS